MGYWLEMIIITGDTSCYYCIIMLSGLPLLYDICVTVLSHLTSLFLGFQLLSYFCYYKDNLGCMNSAYGDMRFKVYL